MTNAALRGKPDAGNPHVRFDEGEVASAATPRRGSLLYRKLCGTILVAVCAAGSAFGANAWMQNARKSPEWFTRGVMYQIQPRAFTPEGTLKAAAKKLPYLKDLGVSIAYLVPVMKMDADTDKAFWSPRQIKSGFENPKNQYRIADYFHVDEEYGTDEDLKDFCAEAHRLGMKVLFDLVYLHCGPTAPFLKEHPEFTWWNADGTVKKGPWRFPKLNFAEPKLREYLMGNIKYLVREYGADGFRCDVGDGIPLDFWCDAHDMMDAQTGGESVLLCEGFTVCDQYKGFDADYGWFPGLDAATVRSRWEGLARQCPVGSKFVNHYENHDIATDRRPRREAQWGREAVDQVLVWMFTIDGVPMLFCGNEMADADERHSMFGKTPMDWSQLGREPGKSRHALVKRLAALRRGHSAFTDVNGEDGLTWLDTTARDSVTAFVRRNGSETVLVVQNWTGKDVSCSVSFKIPRKNLPSYLASDEEDRDIKGNVAAEPLFARGASYSPDTGFALGPFGWWISKVEELSPKGAQGFDFNGAIDKCARAGGGVVTVPSGHHVSNGPIVLRSNVELHLSDGAVVEFSDRVEDYLPGVPVSWEGNECVNVSPLVYAFGCTNVAITGKGVFKPRLGLWRTWWQGRRDAALKAAVNTLKNDWAEKDVPLAERQLWKLPGAKFRPQLFHFNRCRGVRLEGFAAKGTPFWTVHFFLCEDVVARDLDIDAYDDEGNWIGNSDGIDLECTRNALVERCTFRQHDDAIVIKSGKDRDGRRIAMPTEDVVVRDCTVRGGPTFVAIGSELSGGIRNILVENCRVTDEIDKLVKVKTNPRRGGFVDGVTVRGIEAGRVREAMVIVDALYYYGHPGEERLNKLTRGWGGVLLGRLSVQGFSRGERLCASAHGAASQPQRPAAVSA